MRKVGARLAVRVAVAALLLSPLYAVVVSSEVKAEEPSVLTEGWTTDWAAARALAREEGRPLLVVFR